MNIVSKIKNKQNILLGIFFVLFTISYTTNIFRITESDLFHGFERQPEGLVVGRLVRATQDGVFSYGGLTGINYDSQTTRDTEQYAMDLASQHDLYITHKDVPDSFQAYKSQSGGQGIVFSIIQKMLPLNNAKKLMIFRGINALLGALAFVLFGGWVYRAFGFIASLTTLFLIFISSWLNVYAHNLWWVLWNFYLPFLTMLLILEKKHHSPEKVSEWKILAYLFVAVFVKCFFTGFEFITTTLASAFCPLVYYYFVERKTVLQFILFSFKVGVCMIGAVLTQMLMLITQIKFLNGTFYDGIHHIVSSFTKRTEAIDVSHVEVLKMYLQDDVFSLGFLANNIKFYFSSFIFLLIIVGIFLFLKERKIRKIGALLLASLFSILAPLSWFIVFKQHSFEHPHMDYIVWYMPFMLYGFLIIGIVLKIIFRLLNGSTCPQAPTTGF